MPDQPADPLHYEMKMPPEPPAKKDDDNCDKPLAGDAEKSKAQEEAATRRRDDKPQTDRRPG